MLKKILLSVLLFSLSLLNTNVIASTCNKTPTVFQLKSPMARGITMTKNSVTLQKGYRYEKASNSINVISNATGKVTAILACFCTEGFGCMESINGPNFVCLSVGCDGFCAGAVS